MQSLHRNLRALGSIGAQAALLAVAFFLACAVRFDLQFSSGWVTAYFLPLAGPIVGIQLLVFLGMGVHRGSWRYVSLPDLWSLVKGGILALAALLVGLISAQAAANATMGHLLLPGFPETILLLDLLFAVLMLGGARLAVRLVHEESRPSAGAGLTRLLIIGASDAAEAVLRQLQRMPEKKYRIIGLLDDAPAKQRVRIHNVPVIGTVDDLPQLAAKHQIHEVLIAMPNAGKEQMQRIVTLCRRAQVQDAANPQGTVLRFRTVPSMSDVILGRIGGNALSQIRDVSVNDLLGRDAVEMELGAVGSMIQGQVVLVSGAGGSIGSEMCRTICRFEPSLLVLVDKAENAIFEIERELLRTFPTVKLIPAIGDISDAIRVEQIIAEYAPALVFHAAAHKHVPLAELNCGEAIRNNVFGTRTLADAAARGGVKNFVMISTDKAVNPTSIMGATKRCAEIYIQSLARRSHTNFITVRFGNVLGSNGSVVPIFKQQIASGGPVTVTHPEMRRYFMTIPEASQLVLQAAALGQRGEIFILDMGKPVRILDLARDLIMLSGLRPEVDIPIVFTGLRPGEKLYEELSIHGENMVPTRHAKIAVWKSNQPTPAAIQGMIDDLEPLQHCTERGTVLTALVRHIPEMKPWVAEEARTESPQKRLV